MPARLLEEMLELGDNLSDLKNFVISATGVYWEEVFLSFKQMDNGNGNQKGSELMITPHLTHPVNSEYPPLYIMVLYWGGVRAN